MKWNDGWRLIDVHVLTTDGQPGTPEKKQTPFKLCKAFEILPRMNALMFCLNYFSLNYFDVYHNVFWGSKCKRRLIDHESCLSLILVCQRQWSLCLIFESRPERENENLFLSQRFPVIIQPSMICLCRIWKRPNAIMWSSNYLVSASKQTVCW